MLKELTFRRNQVRFIARLMDGQPEFRPDDRSIEEVEQMTAEGDAANDAYVERFTAVSFARGELEVTRLELHDACVAVALALRFAYRKDAVSLERIQRLPTRDQTAAQTEARGQALAGLWAALPPPPGAGTPFALGPLDAGAFAALAGTLADARAGLGEAERAFQAEQAAMRALLRTQGDFVTAAFAHGRALFRDDEVSLHQIRRFPRRRSTPVPRAAEITQANATGDGTVRLEAKAKHATRFFVWRRGPGGKEFQPEAELRAESVGRLVYEADGLPAGEHEWHVAGANSRGTGATSAPVKMTVSGAQAA
jgi:hypothetical protein